MPGIAEHAKTATDEVQDRETAAAVKHARMLASGYSQAGRPLKCCLCTGRVAQGQYVARMPSSWRPETKLRHAHHRCFERLQEWVRARATGQAVAPLTWKPVNAGWAPGAPRQEPLSDKARQRAERASEVRQVATPIIDRDGQRAADYVARYVRDTGTGPLWRELADGLGWPDKPQGLRSYVIRSLARQGWLEVTDQPRSLRPGPAAQPGVPA